MENKKSEMAYWYVCKGCNSQPFVRVWESAEGHICPFCSSIQLEQEGEVKEEQEVRQKPLGDG